MLWCASPSDTLTLCVTVPLQAHTEGREAPSVVLIVFCGLFFFCLLTPVLSAWRLHLLSSDMMLQVTVTSKSPAFEPIQLQQDCVDDIYGNVRSCPLHTVSYYTFLFTCLLLCSGNNTAFIIDCLFLLLWKQYSHTFVCNLYISVLLCIPFLLTFINLPLSLFYPLLYVTI